MKLVFAAAAGTHEREHYVCRPLPRGARQASRAPGLSKSNATIISRLIKAHEDAGLTQQQVSENLEFLHSFLSKCETGERRIDGLELLQLARAYGKPPSFFSKTRAGATPQPLLGTLEVIDRRTGLQNEASSRLRAPPRGRHPFRPKR